MAALPLNVNDVVRATFFAELFGQTILSVFHYRVKQAPTGPDYFPQVDDLAVRLTDQTKDPLLRMLPCQAAELQYTFVRCQRVYPTRDIYAERLIVLNGTHADPCTLPDVSASIEKRTARFGRKGTGRLQLGGNPASQMIDGVWQPAYRGLLQGVADAFPLNVTTVITAGTYKLCLWNGGAITDEDDVFAGTHKQSVRTMHRRTLGLGI